MSITRLYSCARWMLVASTIAACSTDPDANPHRGIDGCKGEPYRGFCIKGRTKPPDDKDAASDEVGMLADAGPGGKDAGPTADAGKGDGGLIGLPDASFDDSGMLLPPPDVKEGSDCSGNIFEPCYLGPEDTEGKGACKAGTRLCECESGEDVCDQRKWGGCFGQVLPSIEVCNNADDDCNGAIDDGIALGSCVVSGSAGACEVGEERCAEGMGVITCEPVNGAIAETCNGINDDCDSATDENTDVPCYPDDTAGCTQNENGGFDCLGQCGPGVQQCVEGELSDCVLPTTPGTETCTEDDETAINEDCDALTDENCDCDDGDSHPCYGGPAGTEGVGECQGGMQFCNEEHQFGECEGEQRPVAETCENVGTNDDCDNSTDEDQGGSCTVGSNFGRCRNGTLGCDDDTLTCITLESLDEDCNGQDDDCDGRIDEDFDLDTNPDNCGSCGNDCDPGFDCCAGNCVNLQIDRNHCGTCPTQCGAGLTCCGARCVNTNTDESNCNTCGNGCPLLAPTCLGGVCRLL